MVQPATKRLVTEASPLLASKASMASYNVFTAYQEIADPTTPELHFGHVGWSGRSWWGQGIDQAAVTALRDWVPVFKGQWFAADDCATTAGSAIITSPAQARFLAGSAVGATVRGPGIPAGATIASVQSLTQATFSVAATATATGVRLAFQGAGSVTDIDYWSHNGFQDPTLGIGKAQPDPGYRLHVVGSSFSGAALGSLKVQAGFSPAVTPAAGGVNGAGFAQVWRDWGGKDHAWVDNTDNNTWAFRLRGDSGTANPVLVVQDVTTDTEKVSLTANGTVKFGGNANAALSYAGPTSQAVQVKSGLAVGFTLGVGTGFSAGNDAVPNANIEIRHTSADDASIVLRTATWANFRILASNTNPGTVTIASQNAVPIVLGTNGVPRITIGANGEHGFFGAAAVAKPTGTPVAATDLTTTTTLVNSLRASLVSLGLVG